MAELFLLVFLNEPNSAVRVAKGTKRDSGVGLREEGGKAVIKEPTDKDPGLIFPSIMLCHLMLWAGDLPSWVHPPCLRNVKNS